MTTHTDNAVNEFARLATMTYAEARAVFTLEHNFLFDLEGKLYEMEALSTTLESLLLDVVNEMRTHSRGRAAAIDYAATMLRQHIDDLAYRYDQLNRSVEPAGGQSGNRQHVAAMEGQPDRQRDERGRYLKQAA